MQYSVFGDLVERVHPGVAQILEIARPRLNRSFRPTLYAVQFSHVHPDVGTRRAVWLHFR